MDPRKHVLPKLWTVLRSGGCGAPSVVYPSLLPLLSLIPPSVIGEGPGFHTEFFKNLWKGLESDTLTGAGSASLVTAFAECVTYFLTRKRWDSDIFFISVLLLTCLLTLFPLQRGSGGKGETKGGLEARKIRP